MVPSKVIHTFGLQPNFAEALGLALQATSIALQNQQSKQSEHCSHIFSLAEE